VLTLKKIGRGAKAAAPELTAALKTVDRPLRPLVALALGRLGEFGKPAAQELVDRLEDKEPQVRAAAAWALWEIRQDAKAVPALAVALRARDAEVRKFAADLLR
jgi:HEAT repeat protein